MASNKSFSTSADKSIDFDIPLKMKLNLQNQEESFQKINDYDYNQMIRFFRQNERIKKYRKKLLVPIKKQNQRWKDNLERCKWQKEEMFQKQRDKLEKKMEERSAKASELIFLNRSSKEKEKKSKLATIELSKKKIKDNLEKFYEETEEKRLETEKKVTLKLNKRVKNQERNIISIRKKFEKLRVEAENRHNKNMSEIYREDEYKKQKNKELKFKQFQNWYFQMQALKKNHQKKKDNNSKAQENAQYVQKQIEQDKENQRLEIERKLHEAEARKEKILQEKQKKLMKEIEHSNALLEQTKANKENLNYFYRNLNRNLLDIQMSKIKKPIEKDFSMDLSKSIIQ